MAFTLCVFESIGRKRWDQPQSGEQKVLLKGSVIIWPGTVPKRPQLRHGISHSCKESGRLFCLAVVAVLGDIDERGKLSDTGRGQLGMEVGRVGIVVYLAGCEQLLRRGKFRLRSCGPCLTGCCEREM